MVPILKDVINEVVIFDKNTQKMIVDEVIDLLKDEQMFLDMKSVLIKLL